MRAIALAAAANQITFGRLLNELTAKVQREVRVLDETVERLEEESDQSGARRNGEPIARLP